MSEGADTSYTIEDVFELLWIIMESETGSAFGPISKERVEYKFKEIEAWKEGRISLLDMTYEEWKKQKGCKDE